MTLTFRPPQKNLRNEILKALLEAEREGDLVLISAVPNQIAEKIAHRMEVDSDTPMLFNREALITILDWLLLFEQDQFDSWRDNPSDWNRVPRCLEPDLVGVIQQIEYFLGILKDSRKK